MTIRYIEVRVTPLTLKTQGGGELHEVDVCVRTMRDRTSVKEVMPEAMFASHLHWLLERVEREVIERSGVAKID